MDISKLFRHTTIVLALAGVIGCSQQDPAEQLRIAEQAVENKEFNAAGIELRNLLKQDESNVKARFLLGEVHFNLGHWAGAIKEFNRALSAQYDKQAIYPHLAQAYYRMRDQEGLETLLADSQSNALTKMHIELFQALQLIQQGQFDSSKAILARLHEQDANHVTAQIGQAILSGLNNEREQAISSLDSVIGAHPDLLLARELKAHMLLSEGDAQSASEYFGEFVKKRPQALEVRLIYANALIAAGNFEEAEKQADILLKLNPGHPLSNLIKAQALFNAEKYQDAYQYAEKASQSNSPLPMARIVAGTSAFKSNNLENAYLHLSAVEEVLPKEHPSYKLLAAIRLQLGYTDEALATLTELDQADALDTEFAAASSAELFKRGQVEQAKDLLDEAQQANPQSAELAFQQALFKFAENDLSAVDDLKKAIELDPGLSNASVALAMNHLRNKEFTEAHKVADDLAGSDEITSQALKGFIYRLQQKPDEARQHLSYVIEQQPGHAGALFNLGLIEESQDNTAAAIANYKQALQAADEHKESASRLMFHLASDTYKDDIEAFFIDLNKSHPKSSVAAVASAEIYRRAGELDQALKVTNQYLSLFPRAERILLMKGQVLLLKQEYSSAADTFDSLIRIAPTSDTARISKIAALEANGDVDGAIAETRLHLKALPQSTPLKLLAANLYLSAGETTLATDYLDQIPENFQQAPEVLRTRGLIALNVAANKDAIGYLAQVHSVAPSMRSLLELVQAHQQAKEYEIAIGLLNSATKSTEQVILPLEMKKAELYSYVDAEKSLEIYRELEKSSDQNFAIMNNLAWTYLQENKIKDAMAAAEIALAKAPNHPDVLDTYGVVQLANGNVDAAMEALQKAYRSNKDNDQYKVHLAQGMLAKNMMEQARSLIQDVNKDLLDPDTAKRLDEVRNRLLF